ncbi:similar to Saccharomyces cerevisiae YDR180W SCC2 Subunit of cohesin loading factor (Scc2p- Scc4p), a complex required for loading of cohesin complexes onto chromosomes [Maudiozyma barnettii]|uniref:Sister chromatid cohesion protein n=1 Tax=Maudiozyma barnettii TaxID=61262 RepID=A0A8H2ZGW4_9SACH|nr:cohesin-loading factor complex subunit SCC2 [Kazachstania barnettii]CAB4253937.1 similar to Saccharomyces cerevisiae YDR180W SCC2 Subunit of cohesin loading factor (Scc2p- Scc4p), a complex required for loading of cohesin complexes onto chromosomes [Kazachstania barnettii]CAD1781687.1 similar to Saccharomyces cerevisiae YDR180W SCC2 Subunit of cohesin loading factor (Scc2p- Scc4p), a complex required for loading of cohesin complexes onto chromosomes [Kazachstania barnettii]
MANFPGENNNDVPKRIVNAISKRPINHLIPKDDIISINDLHMHPTINLATEIPGGLFRNDEITNMIKSEISETTEPSNKDLLELKFIYPQHIKLTEKKNHDDQSTLMKDLSPATLQYMNSRKTHVDASHIVQTSTVSEIVNKKVVLTEEETSFPENILSEQPSKKTKLSTNVSLNQESIGLQYMKDFEELVKILVADTNDEVEGSTELWYSLGKDHFILTEFCLKKIITVLQNISKIPQIWPKLNVQNLIKLLNLSTENIRLSREYINLDFDTNMLKRIGFLSINVTFTIFLFNIEENRLYLEEFVLEPVEFLTECSDFSQDTQNKDDEEMIQLFDNTLSLIPKYILQKPHIDDGLVTRLVYVFSSLLMEETSQSGSNTIINTTLGNIKLTCSRVFISLFEKIPNQREFIIDELLSQMERLPQKRLQKKLARLDNNSFITHLSLTILEMLETINYYDYIQSILAVDNNIIEVLNYHKKVSSEQILQYIDRTIDFIFNKLIHHLAKYRHCLENIVQDLTNALLCGTYPVAENLLSALVNKMLDIFGSSRKYNANIETTCLQQLGHIAGITFDIKRQTKVHEANNLIKICNYPDMLPQWLGSFSKYVSYIKKYTSRSSAFYFTYCMEMNSLLKLYDLMKDTTSDQQETKITIFNAVNTLIHDTTEQPTAITSETVKYHYYSILHSFELINLYEPYLKLVLSILDEDKIKLRSVAIKSLSVLITKDNNVLSSPMVRTTITDLLRNPTAASIKDAILDLVSIGSAYIRFYKEININYDSDSLQVRRHILRINEKIYDETIDQETKIYVFSRVLMKIEDEEDNIIDIAREIILGKWILILTDLRNLPEKEYETCYQIIQIMSGVISLSEKCSDLFSWFLNFYLLNDEYHSVRRYTEIKDNLKIITNNLVQMIIELQAKDIDDNDINPEKQKLLNLLSLFSDSVVPFISKDHIIGLYPYMVTDARSNLYFHILHTYKNSMQQLTNFKPKFLFELETTLLTALPKMTVKEIDEAIPLAWCVARQRNDFGRLLKACSSCFTLLNPYVNLANNNLHKLSLDSKLQRLLYLASGFARFTNFDTTVIHISYVPDGEPVYEYVAKCMLIFSKGDIDHIIRRIAIKNLTKLCGNHPRLFNSKHILKILDTEFKGKNLDIQLVILESFYDFFVQEEKHSLRQTGETSYMSSDKQRKKRTKMNQRTEFLNDGICTALVARYIQNILRICLLTEFKNALVGIRLLKLVLEYGYTNPSLCVPTVVALLSSTNTYIKKITINLFTMLMEKYETMVYSGLPKGVLLAIKYATDCNTTEYYKNDQFLLLLQRNMTTSKGSIAKFNKRLLNTVDMLLGACLNETTMNENVHIVLYIASNISTMRFQDQHELLIFIRKIDTKYEQMKEIAYSHGKMAMETPELLINFPAKSKLRNIIVATVIFEKLKLYLINLYSLKEDILLYDEIQEDDLKGRPAVLNKNILQPLQNIINDIILKFEDDEALIDYLDNLD